MKKTRILFVCYGNICRSPMAEFIFRKLAAEAGVSEAFSVASRATSREEIVNGVGNPVYPPAKRELAKHGIACDGKRAEQLCAADADRFDLFVGMDSDNIRDMHRILGEACAPRIKKLMDYTARGGDVADPWYSERFDIAYRDISEGCQALFASLLKKSLL